MKTTCFPLLLILLLLAISLVMTSSQVTAQDGSPTEFALASIQFEDEVRSVTVTDNLAYVGLRSKLILLDITNPLAVKSLGTVDVPLRASIKSEHYLCGVSGLRFYVIDVASPIRPIVLSDSGFSGVDEHYDVAIHGSLAYIGHQRGLAAIDVSNPYSPTLVGNLRYTLGQVHSVDVRKDPSGKSERIFAYLGTVEDIVYGGGLKIVDVTDPTDMQEVYPCSNEIPCATGVATSDLSLIDHYAYVLNDTRPWNEGNGLAIMDVTDVANVRQIGFYNLPDTALYHMAVAGGKSHIAATKYVDNETREDLLTLDVMDKTMPRQVGLQALENEAQYARMAASGPCLYIAQGPKGLKILCDTTVTPTPPPLVWLPLIATPAS